MIRIYSHPHQDESLRSLLAQLIKRVHKFINVYRYKSDDTY
jgi:hypothetical protein